MVAAFRHADACTPFLFCSPTEQGIFSKSWKFGRILVHAEVNLLAGSNTCTAQQMKLKQRFFDLKQGIFFAKQGFLSGEQGKLLTNDNASPAASFLSSISALPRIPSAAAAHVTPAQNNWMALCSHVNQIEHLSSPTPISIGHTAPPVSNAGPNLVTADPTPRPYPFCGLQSDRLFRAPCGGEIGAAHQMESVG